MNHWNPNGKIYKLKMIAKWIDHWHSETKTRQSVKQDTRRKTAYTCAPLNLFFWTTNLTKATIFSLRNVTFKIDTKIQASYRFLIVKRHIKLIQSWKWGSQKRNSSQHHSLKVRNEDANCCLEIHNMSFVRQTGLGNTQRYHGVRVLRIRPLLDYHIYRFRTAQFPSIFGMMCHRNSTKIQQGLTRCTGLCPTTRWKSNFQNSKKLISAVQSKKTGHVKQGHSTKFGKCDNATRTMSHSKLAEVLQSHKLHGIVSW